jgi:septum formation topological specificity factor MinE
MLFLFGQEYADRVAAEREWKIDPAIVAEYRAGVAEIVARYSEVEQ